MPLSCLLLPGAPMKKMRRTRGRFSEDRKLTLGRLNLLHEELEWFFRPSDKELFEEILE